mmetsp:Transcript_5332/g.5494  ORF Transcript_5332/g.5494 Transcript_5332/m.5494 type:complete len:134 (+) Transcript_5332:48-449(+)
MVKMLSSSLLLCVAILFQIAVVRSTELYVCAAGDPVLLGSYTSSSADMMDGVPTFTNSNEMSFFRNNGFWYLGDLTSWPPKTHYRCVQPEGCNVGEAVPPTTAQGVWTVNKALGTEPIPEITLTQCASSKEEL